MHVFIWMCHITDNTPVILAPKDSVASTSSRTVEALQLPNIKVTGTSPSISRKSSFITNELYNSRQSSARSLISSEVATRYALLS